jgi:hypothetical protein
MDHFLPEIPAQMKQSEQMHSHRAGKGKAAPLLN